MTDSTRPSPPARLNRWGRLLTKALNCAVAASLMLTAWPSHAQFKLGDPSHVTPRMQTNQELDSKAIDSATRKTTADYIVAVVNQEVITHSDIDRRLARIQQSAQGQELPPVDELRKQVLDLLIDEKVQVNQAKVLGMDVSDAEVDGTIESIAAQNQMSVSEMRARMASQGMDFTRYRNSLREQLLLQRVREREVTARIKITDEELDQIIAKDAQNGIEASLNLAHILIRVPEGASPQEVAQLQARAQEIRDQAARGVNFTQLARQYSDDLNTAKSGGVFGSRPISKLPELFVNAVSSIKVGEVAPLVRSGAGFHIIKLIERENASLATYTQQRVRHILLRTSPQQDAKAVMAKMIDIRRQIVGGQASFPQMARQYSEDGSAVRGGDLGWSSPGQFVPEFEKALAELQPGQISDPVVTRFGVHLIQLLERREVALTPEQKREIARNMLREQRFEATYTDWARELRASTWVEVRDAP
ncbi:MAG TPA: peptidylprolyl isomerase [Aquabacterium sp.]|nr:peptidylprolyl isomerase [Aquabacterium sp.]